MLRGLAIWNIVLVSILFAIIVIYLAAIAALRILENIDSKADIMLDMYGFIVQNKIWLVLPIFIFGISSITTSAILASRIPKDK